MAHREGAVAHRSWLLRRVAVAVAGGVVAGIVAAHMYSITLGLCASVLLVAVAVWLKERSVPFVLWWVASQNFVVPFLYARLGSYSQESAIWTGLVASSEAFCLVFLGINWLGVKRAPWWGASVAYIVAVLFFEGIQPGLHFSSLNSIRSGMIPVIFCLLGAVYVSMQGHTEDVVIGMARTVGWISIVGAGSVLIDHFFMSSAFWSQTMKLAQYWVDVKHLPATYVVNGLPGDIVKVYSGRIIRRGVGIYGDPLAAGYSMAIGSICFLFSERNRRLWWYAAYGVIVAAVIMTGTRAAMVMIVIGVVGYLWSNGIRKGWLLGVLVVAGIVYGGYPLIAAAIHGTGDVEGHLRSFAHLPAMLRHPLGDKSLGTTLEGALFDYWDQGGILLVVPAIIFMRRLYKCMPPGIGRTVFWALIVTAPISFELLGDTSCGAGWVIIGACAQAWSGRQRVGRDVGASLIDVPRSRAEPGSESVRRC